MENEKPPELKFCIDFINEKLRQDKEKETIEKNNAEFIFELEKIKEEVLK